jgi:hypothetical protein
MKKILLAFTMVICLLILAGCKHIDYGTVIEKSFSPAHKTYSPMIMHGNKTTRIIPRWIHHSDNWSILVENEDGKEWWEVSEAYYNSVEIGNNVDRRKKE